MQVTKIRHKSEPKKSWFKAVLLVTIWLLIYSMYRDYRRISKGFERKKTAEVTYEQKVEEKQRLEEEFQRVNSLNYREKLIREKLNMQKVDEVVAILPDSDTTGEIDRIQTGDREDPNWKKWASLVW